MVITQTASHETSSAIVGKISDSADDFSVAGGGNFAVFVNYRENAVNNKVGENGLWLEKFPSQFST